MEEQQVTKNSFPRAETVEREVCRQVLMDAARAFDLFK
jgi:hypothetical protein